MFLPSASAFSQGTRIFPSAPAPSRSLTQQFKKNLPLARAIPSPWRERVRVRVGGKASKPLRSYQGSGFGEGFTLIELMIVISIIAITMAVGIPMAYRAMDKSELLRAANDIVEACSHARAQAILRGVPGTMIIRAEDGKILVPSQSASAPGPEQEKSESSSGPVFSAALHEDIIVELIAVNLIDRMEDSQARVFFYPNGTSDEFTIVLKSQEGVFKVSLDMITGLASKERIQ